jgi:hypothetical protein
MNFCGHCGARLEDGRCPSCAADWSDLDDEAADLDDPISWRRSQIVLAAVLASLLLLAGLGVALWNVVKDDEPAALEFVPEVETTSPPTATSVLNAVTLPLPSTTSAMTLPSTTLLELMPMRPGGGFPPTPPNSSVAVLAPVPTQAPTGTGTTSPSAPKPTSTAAPQPGDGGEVVVTDPGEVPATDPVTDIDAPPVPSTDPVPTDPPTTTTTEPPPPPPPPTDPPLVARGSSVYLQDPMPSGTPYGAVAGALGVAQQLADQLANGRWITARAIAPALSGTSDDALAATYGSIDRLSAVLSDARPNGSGYDLRLAFMSNERGVTNVLCTTWWVDAGAGVVVPRQLNRILQYDGTFPASYAIDNADLNTQIRTLCN